MRATRRDGAAPAIVALILAVAALAAWRAQCVVAGPDQDTDAYAHHMIARAILADPRDLAVHWVWLPLFHYAQVPLVALGGTMDDVRWCNVVLSAAVPFVLFAYVRETATTRGSAMTADAVALVAAIVAAACPIAMQMGTTAQPEPLFALVILGTAIAMQKRKHLAAAALLGAAAVLRYEAWPVVALAGALVVVDAWRARKIDARACLVVAAPIALVVAWAWLRRPVDGAWFGFLRQTRDFANDATREHSALDRGALALAHDVFFYAAIVPARVMWPALPIAAAGIVRTVKQQGSRFTLVFGACLAFVTLTWVMRSSLGLDRHFVVLVPLYATFAAQGVAVIADFAARWLRPMAARAVAGAIAIASIAVLFGRLADWMVDWKGSIARGWPDRSALGAYLRTLPEGATIFCDDATLEVLSELDRRRFDRHWVDDPHTWDVVRGVARRDGETFVATWRRKLTGHENAGDIVFRAGQTEGDAASGVAVMRVTFH